jgi:hypothetical protein
VCLLVSAYVQAHVLSDLLLRSTRFPACQSSHHQFSSGRLSSCRFLYPRMTFFRSMRELLNSFFSGSDEYRYDTEPSTTPTLPSVYEVAKFGAARDEICSRRPCGIWKSSSSASVSASLGRILPRPTSCCGVQGAIGIVQVPVRGFVECILHILHEIQHVAVTSEACWWAREMFKSLKLA